MGVYAVVYVTKHYSVQTIIQLQNDGFKYLYSGVETILNEFNLD